MSRTLLTSWSEHRIAIADTMAAAVRQIDIFERDLARVGMDLQPTIDGLTQFFSENDRATLRLVVPDLDAVRTRHPRFMQLVERWRHRLSVRKTPEHLAHLPDCMILADARHATIRFQHDQARAVVLTDAIEAVLPYQTRFDELWAECSETLSLRTLGL